MDAEESCATGAIGLSNQIFTERCKSSHFPIITYQKNLQKEEPYPSNRLVAAILETWKLYRI
jgi:hypothetical protein